MRVEALTFLRFVAAFVVVVGHFGGRTGFAQAVGPAAVAGPQMVTFFFVLSGFVMVVSQWSKDDFSTRSFYRSRLARIAPIYWVSMVAMCFLGNEVPPPATKILLNAIFLQAWFPWYQSINGPAWTLSIEAFCYLVFPFCFALLQTRRFTPQRLLWMSLAFWAACQLVLTTSLNSSLYGGHPSVSHNLIFQSPPSHLCSFVLGLAGGYWHVAGSGTRADRGMGGLALLLFLFVAAFSLVQHRAAIDAAVGLRLPLGSSFLAPFLLALILGVARADNVLTRLLSLPLLRRLGDLSYAFYILQVPVQKLFKRHALGDRPIANDGEFWAYVAVLLVVSQLSAWFIEKPGGRLIRRLDLGRKPDASS